MPNALAHATSPYLQQHADNPVAWLEWGEAAFARARAEDKPIFLSIGYSTCHWCHVMAHESFEDEAIAALLNTHFIPVKVDREERPDVDRVYMSYVQALTGHGGWPLSAWLTPELKPFFGGTYFPPEDRPGRAGFPTVLRSILKAWAEEREKLVTESERVLTHLRDHHAQLAAAGDPADTDLTEPVSEAYETAYHYLRDNFDAQAGGFGGAPKFPRSSNLDFLFRCTVIQGAHTETGEEALTLATRTLEYMARGGIHDHLGGGFHRYAVDDGWRLPHFEKMLYDQAQITVNYLDAFAATGREAFAWTARGICDYVLRDLRHAAGGFFSAEDADSEPPGGATGQGHGGKVEGAFYVWGIEEVRELLGEDAALVIEHFGLTTEGNVPRQLDPQGEFPGLNVLAAVRPWPATAQRLGLDPEADAGRFAAALARLHEARASRPRPHCDQKIITAWNGLMIGALARAATTPAACLDDRRAAYLAAAVAAAEFTHRELTWDKPEQLRRTWRDGRGGGPGFAEDYAFLIAGLLDLYEATFDYRWLEWADALQSRMDTDFGDAAAGGYFNTTATDASILLRLKDDYDGAEPSPNSVAASNLLRLAALGLDETRAETAGRTILALRERWAHAPQALPALLCAMERLLALPRQIVIAGDPATAAFQALAEVARTRPGPPRALLAADGGAGQAWLATRHPVMAAMRPVEGRASAYVCEAFTCQAPVTDSAALREQLGVV